jgi:hypothetical protein
MFSISMQSNTDAPVAQRNSLRNLHPMSDSDSEEAADLPV